MNKETTLPTLWTSAKLVDISHINMGQSPPSSTYNTQQIGLPFFQGKTEFGSFYPNINKYCSEPLKIAEKDNILISVRAPIGPTNIAPEKSCIGRGLASINGYGGIPNRFILYYLRYIEKDLVNLGTGSTFQAISKKNLEDLLVVVPPLSEQHEIVEKIEELFNELDLAEKMFLKIQKKIKIYKQVILRTAFNGELTQKERDASLSTSAFDYLTEIAKNRKDKYDQAQKTGKKLKKDFDFEFDYNPNISRWAIAKLDKLISINARVGWKGLKKEEYTKEGPLFLSVHCLNYGKYVEFKDAYNITEKRYEESPEIKLAVNDVLLCKDGAGIGKIGIVKQLNEKATINSSLAIIRGKEAFLPDYLYYLFLGPQLQALVNERISGSAIPHLFQKDIREFRLNVPPPEEQQQIIHEIEYRFTIAEKLEEIILLNQKRISTFRKKILQNAFSGQLITSDPNGESAELLLQKIALEKTEYFKKQKLIEKQKPVKRKIMVEKKTIIEILKSSQSPISAEEVWLQSEHKDKIENFYAALKLIQNDIIAVKKGSQSLLSLKHENR
ncbi:restriction endonuclease subunit S [Flavobacterium sp. ENC]|uniref:restriction endonuclease subunit S n=1 Tax=Flavobacterium sp. ENC TaxID=2897330 RepID=UPI001E625838|nr:restriction endonuclease subunit S [Flavobacterium sp. ENC]MCD0464065.1 restriction endonuclease subunit S [Flavobacterium sp. ENC]